MKILPLFLFVALAMGTARAEDAAPLTAPELAARLAAIQLAGATYVRARLEIKPSAGPATTLQLQIKSRRTARSTDLVYQVLFPKERKGEAVLLHRGAGRPPGGWSFAPPDALRPIAAAQMKDELFGSDLSYEDLSDHFLAWERQAFVGNESVNGVPCQILESRPGKDEASIYGSVRSWVDLSRLVPLRIEKYGPGGALLRRIDTTRVIKDAQGQAIPASFAVQRPGHDSVTTVEGSRSEHGNEYPDAEFTPEAIRQVTAPRHGVE